MCSFFLLFIMKNPRLVFRVIIKVLMVLGLLILLWVFASSLFVHQDKEPVVEHDLLELDLKDMRDGNVRKIRWEGKEIGILKRKGHHVLGYTKYVAKIPHQSLNSALRSLTKEYFVYYNHGNSGNCPLFNEGNGFKDTCTGTHFDTTGRETDKGLQGARLEIPPHYFQDDKLFIGAWKEE